MEATCGCGAALALAPVKQVDSWAWAPERNGNERLVLAFAHWAVRMCSQGVGGADIMRASLQFAGRKEERSKCKQERTVSILLAPTEARRFSRAKRGSFGAAPKQSKSMNSWLERSNNLQRRAKGALLLSGALLAEERRAVCCCCRCEIIYSFITLLLALLGSRPEAREVCSRFGEKKFR